MFELFLFALILVLPQVDLPDFAFQRGSAPIVAKAKVSARPVLATVRHTAETSRLQYVREFQSSTAPPLDSATADFSLSLLCSWIC